MMMHSEKNRRPEWISHIPMSRSMSFLFNFIFLIGLGTGQLLKDKFQKRNTVQYLTLKSNPIQSWFQTLCVYEGVFVCTCEYISLCNNTQWINMIMALLIDNAGEQRKTISNETSLQAPG